MGGRPLALALLLALLAAGCVTRGTHRDVVSERDRLTEANQRLSERVRLLEASNVSLSSERIALLEELEDLRQEQASLDKRVRELRRTRSVLEASLRQREEQVAELERLHGTYEALVADLESEVSAGQIQIEQLREGLRLNLSDQILFPSGSAELSAGGRRVLRTVAAQLTELPHRVEVQGHTDDIPIRGGLAGRFPSNWELAGARAARVVRLLHEAGVDATRLTAVSFGAQHPVAGNDTPEGRARNRRIEIRLIPIRATRLAPAGAEAAAPDASTPAASAP
jgi:chemotaxis protein MotB